MIDSIIFDMDGIIIDSEPLWEKAEVALIKKHGKNYNNSYRKNIIGLNQKDSVNLLKNTFHIDNSVNQIIEERKEILLDIYRKELRLFPGILKLLDEVKNLGLKTGLASGSPENVIQFVIEKFGLSNYFSEIVSGDSTSQGKPAPEIYSKTVKLLKTKPKNCIAIEDSVNGVLSVKNAGMFCIAVPHPELDRSRYSSADIIFESVSDIKIKPLIEKLNSV